MQYAETGSGLSMQQINLNYLTDGHGDIREITDSTGNTLVRYSYDVWGSPTIRSQEPESRIQELAELNPYRYASYRYESETGMYYLRARYYDPVTGRFLSKDPIPYQNKYIYVKNNPVNSYDFSGLGTEHKAKVTVLNHYYDTPGNLLTLVGLSYTWKYDGSSVYGRSITKWRWYFNDGWKVLESGFSRNDSKNKASYWVKFAWGEYNWWPHTQKDYITVYKDGKYIAGGSFSGSLGDGWFWWTYIVIWKKFY